MGNDILGAWVSKEVAQLNKRLVILSDLNNRFSFKIQSSVEEIYS